MRVWTSQYVYPGPYRLDVTVKGQDPIGKLFAPTWDMVMAHKNSDKSEAANAAYIAKYHQIILNVIQNHPEEWKALLARPDVVIVCFCPPGHFCHRHLLVHYLKHYGAIYQGEITDFSRWRNEPRVINEFRGEFSWASNFAPCKVVYDNIEYDCTENLYQALKYPKDWMLTIYVDELKHGKFKKVEQQVNARWHIAKLSPGKAKRLGKKAPLPWDWDGQQRKDAMQICIDLKYDKPEFGKLLLATEDWVLIEGNHWHDNYWGNCTCPKCEHKKGANMLGKMTMSKRASLRAI